MSFLLDTCVLSEPARPRPTERVRRWLNAVPSERVFVSVVTIGEIEQGIAHLGATARAAELGLWLQRTILPAFESRLLLVDLPVATLWGRMCGEALRRGRPLALVDSLVAATARVHRLTVVTRNVADFEALGVSLLNPWETR